MINILKEIVEELEDSKAIDIVSIDISKKTSLADHLVFATGTSNRHVNSISQSVHKKLKNLDIVTPLIEGNQDSGWIVIDSGDVIIHLFKEEIRQFYNLENMWSAEIE
ncbi:ribosome silencing factor [Pelagibacteraceae bacterium]|nr:ribosome silencing factor [Pelagibacteraceae bacterium]